MKKIIEGSFFFTVTAIALTGIFKFSPEARRKAAGWYKEPLSVEYTLESLESIEIKSTSQNIKIKVSDSAAEVTVKYYTNWNGHVTDNRSSSLKIEEHWEQNWKYIFLPKLDHLANRDSYITLEITVPKGTDLTKLKVTAKSGKIEIAGITANAAALNAANQNILIADCDFEDTNISNISGSTSIKNSSLGSKGKISHTSGNMNLTNCTIDNDFKIEGSCTLTSCTFGEDIKITNMNGNVKICETVFSGIAISSASGNVTVSSIPDIELCSFDLKAAAGTIKVSGTNQGTIYNVKPNGRQSELKINAASGNIAIN